MAHSDDEHTSNAAGTPAGLESQAANAGEHKPSGMTRVVRDRKGARERPEAARHRRLRGLAHERVGGGSRHPFTPVRTAPSMKKRWEMKKMISGGMIETSVAAMR